MSRRGPRPYHLLALLAMVTVSMAVPARSRSVYRAAQAGQGPATRTHVVQLLANSGFENGDLRPWRAAGTLPPRVILAPRYGGRYAALIGRLGTRTGPAGASALSVSIAIPPGAARAGLLLRAWRRCGAAHPRSALTITVSEAIERRMEPLSRPLEGCSPAGRWARVALDVSRARGHTVVVVAAVRVAAGEEAALVLDDAYLSASVAVTATPRATPTPSAPRTATATATATASPATTVAVTATTAASSTRPAATPLMTATATVSGTPAATATATDVPDICAAPAVVATYQAILSSFTATPTPRPTSTASATPAGAIVTPTRTPVRSNIPRPVTTDTPASGPTPGYTPLPGPSPTVGATCHPVVKGISYPFVLRDGGVSSAATPVVNVGSAYEVGATGALHVRVDFHLVHDASWTGAEYGAYDAAMQSFCGVHVDVLGLVGAGVVSPLSDPTTWIANNRERAGGDGDNPFMRLFAQRVLELVGRYHSCVHTWEIWNEPNVGYAGATGTYIYPSNFAALLADTYAQVKKAYPDVTLVSGGILSVDPGNQVDGRTSGADYLRQTYHMGLDVTHTWDAARAQFGGAPLDAVGQHLYLDQGGLVYTRRIIDAYRYMHDAYGAFGDGAKPIYMTEGAWSTGTVSPALQALNLDMLYSMSASPAVPYVARAYWYLLRDGDSPDQAYGLETADGGHKPAYDRFQAY